jgi:hypothetical protein
MSSGYYLSSPCVCFIEVGINAEALNMTEAAGLRLSDEPGVNPDNKQIHLAIGQRKQSTLHPPASTYGRAQSVVREHKQDYR